jgi:hypothetical protein
MHVSARKKLPEMQSLEYDWLAIVQSTVGMMHDGDIWILVMFKQALKLEEILENMEKGSS